MRQRSGIRGIRLGDAVEIPLSDGRYAYAQYLRYDEGSRRERMGAGPLIRVFDGISPRPLKTDDLRGRGDLFPPLYVGLGFAIRSKRWKVIGPLPIPEIHPVFRSTWGLKPGKYNDWIIIRDEGIERVGELPTELRNLEMLLGWSPQLVEDRILGRRLPILEKY